MIIAIFLIVVVVVGVLVALQGRAAHATTVVQSPLGPDAAAQVVASAFKGFGAGNWRQTGGQGALNFETNTVKGGTATLSIDIEPSGSGSSVSMWMSSSSTSMGLSKGGGVVLQKKKKIAKKLARG